MLPLKYLFEDFDLAKTILSAWDYDEDGLDEAFKYFRISSNAVYPFTFDGKKRYLRFAPEEEKGEESCHAELEFIEYLADNGYPCARPVASKDGNLIESVSTDNGAYIAVVFEGAPGHRLDRVKPTAELIGKAGAALGRLHKLSAAYIPEEKPWDPGSVLGWCFQELTQLENTESAVWEVTQLSDTMSASIRHSKDCYGVIHYDFEPDNLFISEDGTVTAIDFEDCMTGWYALDFDIAATSLSEWLEDYPDSISEQEARMAFMNGYRSEYTLPGRMLAYLPQLRRFAHIFEYTRIVRAIAEPVENPPEWMNEVREKLQKRALELEQFFCPVELKE